MISLLMKMILTNYTNSIQDNVYCLLYHCLYSMDKNIISRKQHEDREMLMKVLLLLFPVGRWNSSQQHIQELLPDRYQFLQTGTSSYRQVQVLTDRYKYLHTGTSTYRQVQVLTARYQYLQTGTSAYRQVQVLTDRYKYLQTGTSTSTYRQVQVQVLTDRYKYLQTGKSTYIQVQVITDR